MYGCCAGDKQSAKGAQRWVQGKEHTVVSGKYGSCIKDRRALAKGDGAGGKQTAVMNRSVCS